ncbi:hypothetical protein LENED_000643 [Lentinula edodes]|uniref:Uncharacterized protein n=1 Tax=Lentinula edodes TaxID=5353 RepID=A0A1Q3DW29_LENED|nr:hypothetical protein LENED_000643 [Lentinula edodes]
MEFPSLEMEIQVWAAFLDASRTVLTVLFLHLQQLLEAFSPALLHQKYPGNDILPNYKNTLYARTIPGLPLGPSLLLNFFSVDVLNYSYSISVRILYTPARIYVSKSVIL